MKNSFALPGYPGSLRLSTGALTALLLAAGLAFTAAGETFAQNRDSLTARMWDPSTLSGDASEKRSKGVDPPDYSPPARVAPLTALPPLPAALAGSIRRVADPTVKAVALTFDLCELADHVSGYDAGVVDTLRRENVPATFFAGGKWMRSHPERAKQLIADPLFEIGNHAWTHGNFGVMSREQMRDQVLFAQAQYETLREEVAALAAKRGLAPQDLAAIPKVPAVFRFPYGRCRPEALDLLASLGVAAVQWDVNSQDAGKTETGMSVAARVLAKVKPGSIVLCHANGNGHGTAEALPGIIAGLTAKGYTFVTVSRLLALGKAETSKECYADSPGDTEIYDKIFGDGVLHPKKK